MKATLYFPYVNGDPTRDYRYKGREISTEQYIKLHESVYKKNKVGVDAMMDPVTGRYGHNISINNYDKRPIDVKKVSYSYFECPCRLLTRNARELPYEDIKDAINTDQKLLVMLQLNTNYVDKQPDLNIELNSWLKQSSKILGERRLTDEEKVFHLPKKDLQIYADEDGQPVVLKDCKVVELKNTLTTFMILVNSVYVGKDMLRLREAAAKVR